MIHTIEVQAYPQESEKEVELFRGIEIASSFFLSTQLCQFKSSYDCTTI